MERESTERFRYTVSDTPSSPKFMKVAYGNGMPSNLKRSWMARIQLPVFFLCFLVSTWKSARHVDYIHCHWLPAGLIGRLVQPKGCKMLLTLHHGHKKNSLFKWILKGVNVAVFNSSYTQEKTNAIFPVPKQEIIYPGIDPNFFCPPEVSAVQEKLQVLFVGRLIKLKGPDILLEAFLDVQNELENINISLVFVGEGPMRNELEQRVNEMQLTEKVTLKGQVGRQNLLEIYRESSVFIIPTILTPSGESEGFGLSAVEASSCGLPVIGSASGGIKDIVDHGENGYLFEPSNVSELKSRLMDVLTHPDNRKEMGVKARKKVLSHFLIG